MKQKKAAFTQTPFENLRELLERKKIKIYPNSPKNDLAACCKKKGAPATERELFLEAMSDVVPIKKKQYKRFNCNCHHKSNPPPPQFDSCLKELDNLIKSGKGFVIAQTAEYMEGAQAKAHPEITRLLHDGHFTIQDHIDLHGLNVTNAKKCLDSFMRNAVTTRKKGLLIVHGRGLSSPVEPVLKYRVYQWLTSGPWRKWVIAFASARACDGGAGATYVLLRNYPAKKYKRKKNIDIKN
jgi:DNA-nicking Smr family endonuclease